MTSRLEIPEAPLTAFCRANGIRRLALFGSVLREDFNAESDVDVLVEFEPGHAPGLLRLARMQAELSQIIGRPTDLRTPNELSRYFRSAVLAQAETRYVA